MSSVCISCEAPIIWAVTPKGEKTPIDRMADREKGNTLLLRSSHFPDAPLAVVLSAAALETARANGPLWLNHWASCPNREEHRRQVDARKAAEREG